MSTPQNINTVVRGSVGMLQEAARALAEGHQAAEQADDAHHKARGTAQDSWRGEGADAFLDDLERQLTITRNLAKTCEVYKHAFEDLAGTLEVVKNDMDKIRGTATSGGLEVQGPIVLRPDSRPGPAPRPSDYVGNAAGYADAMHTHSAQVEAYNAKVRVFNTCLSIYTDARNKEKQGHIDFWDAVRAGEGFDLDDAWKIGTTTAGASLGVLGGMENSRADLLAKLQKLEPQSQTYQMIASGRITLDGLSAKQRMQVMGNYSRSKASEVNYRKQLNQLTKVSEYVPEKLQRAAAANPSSLAKNPQLAGKMAKVFSRLPWAGSGITVLTEYKQAATGEQTWAHAVADTVGTLGGGWVGGALGAQLCPVFRPWGPLVCGASGAIIGSIVGDNVADFVVPEEADLPKPAQPVPDHSNAPPLYPR